MSSAPVMRVTNLEWRRRKARLFRGLCAGLTWLAVLLLGVLLVHVTRQGLGWIDWQFLTEFP